MTEGEALGHKYVSGFCSLCGEEQKILIYDDSIVSIYYLGINCYGSVDLYLYAENKSDYDLGITLEDSSINGNMVYFGGYLNVAAGKNAKEEYYYNLTSEYGDVYGADTIEFKLIISDGETYHTIVKTNPIKIDVNNGTISSSGSSSDNSSAHYDNDLSQNAIGRLDYEIPSSVSDDSGFKYLDDSNLKLMKNNLSSSFINSYGLIGDTYYEHYVLPYFADEYKNKTYEYDDLLDVLKDMNEAGYDVLKAYYGSGSYHHEIVISIDLDGQQIIADFRDGITQTDNTMDYFSLD